MPSSLRQSQVSDWAKYQLFMKSKVEVEEISGTIHTRTAERVKEIVDSLSHSIVPDRYPLQLQLNLTSTCSRKRSAKGDCFNCSFPTSRGEHYEIGKLLGELRQFAKFGGKSIFLSGGGEPGNYRDLEILLQFLSDDDDGRALELTLNTHGAFVKRMVRLSESSDFQGAEWQDRLRRIFSGSKSQSDVLSMISISWHDDSQANRAISQLNQIRNELDLKLTIRVSSLVYADPALSNNTNRLSSGYVGGEPFAMTTSIAQIQRIMDSARQSGADIVSFKPAHINDGSGRKSVKNEPAYEYISSLINDQQYTAYMNNWDWNLCKNIEKFGVLLERAPRLNRLTNSYQTAIDQLGKQHIFCIAPLVMLFGSSNGFAACCDTWDEGLGSKAFLLSSSLQLPYQQFLSNLYWMITSIDQFWPTECVRGCGWTELNLRNPIRIWAGNLVSQFAEGKIERHDVWNEIARYFRDSIAQNFESLSPDIPEFPLYESL